MTTTFSFISSTLFFIFMTCVKGVYQLIQRVTWYINGVQAARDKAASGACYDRSVHVCKVLWGKKLGHIMQSNSSEFIKSHVEFVHPKILLDPNISLYGLDQKEATFLKTKSSVDIFSSDTHPFMKFAQADNSVMVYTIPLWAFQKFAEEVGDPVLPIIWISSIGRCGSTLLGQVFEKIPGTISLGEPDAITALTFLNKSEKISKQGARDLLRSVIRIQCRYLPGAQRIVLKVASFTFAEVKDIHEMFPKIKHVFLYRRMQPYVKSVISLVDSEPTGLIIKKITDWFSFIRREFYRDGIRIDRDDHFLEDLAPTLDFVGLWVILAVSIIQRYKEFVDEGIPMFAILYEDLTAHKEQIVTEMFRRLSIPQKYVSISLTAFENDSQRGSAFSGRQRRDRREPSARDLTQTNEILRRYGFPSSESVIDVPNRIVPSGQ